MQDGLERLEVELREFQQNADLDYVDPGRLSSLVDSLQGTLCEVLNRAKKRGHHLLTGQTPCGWAAQTCRLTPNSASDRLCVGKHLESMPKVAGALSDGEIGYQSVSVICHLREKLGKQAELLDEEEWIRYARENSIKSLGQIADHMRYVIDPDGFERDTEENYEERFLHVSEMNGMYHLSGVIDPEGGAARRVESVDVSRQGCRVDPRLPGPRTYGRPDRPPRPSKAAPG